MIEAYKRKEQRLEARHPGMEEEAEINAEFKVFEDRMLDTPHLTPAGAALKLSWMWALVEGGVSLLAHVVHGTPIDDGELPPHCFERRMIDIIDDILRMESTHA